MTLRNTVKDPFRGAYFWRGLSKEGNLCFQIDWASLRAGGKFTVLLCFTLYLEAINVPSTSPRGAYIWRGHLTEGFLCYQFGGLIFGGTYTWRGLFSEFQYQSINFTKEREKLLYLLQLTVIKQLHWRKINARQQFIECSFPIFSHFILLLKIFVIVRKI